jgi:predicted transcriptional regulator
MVRELVRLRDLGFIKFEPEGNDLKVSVDFTAISRH